MSALVLTAADVSRNLDSLLLLSELRDAFRAHTRDAATSRGPEGAGTLPDVPAYSLRTGGGPGVVALRPQLQLHEVGSGAPLAVMDAEHLHAVRAAVVAALAADVLGRPDASRVALVGLGEHALLGLKCLRLVRSLTHVSVWDPDPAHAFAFGRRAYQALKLPADATDTVEEAVASADLVVTATDAHEPLLFPDMVRAGTHVSALGAPQREVSPSLLRMARVVVDDRAAALARGGVLGAAGLGPETPTATLGEVLEGRAPGRTSPEERTVFAGVGLPFEDLAAAWHVYLGARAAAEPQPL